MFTPLSDYCEHHFCRSMRASELADMNLLDEAIAVHNKKVRCRKKKKEKENDA